MSDRSASQCEAASGSRIPRACRLPDRIVVGRGLVVRLANEVIARETAVMEPRGGAFPAEELEIVPLGPGDEGKVIGEGGETVGMADERGPAV